MAILVLTRPEEASRRFLDAVEKSLGRPMPHILSPAIEIQAVPHGRIPEDSGAIILTSEQGARRARGAGAWAGMQAWCVGDRTADAARDEGFAAISAGGDVEALIGAILAAGPKAPLVHIRGEQTTGDVSARLTAAGLSTGELVVYRQAERGLPPELLEALAGDERLVVPLFSPRSAESFLRRIAGADALRIVAMSAAVADAAQANGARDIHMAERPDLAAMVLATCRRLSRA